MAQHLDILFVKNSERVRKAAIGERTSRAWYCTVNQWVSDFNSLTVQGSTHPGGGKDSGTAPGSAAPGMQRLTSTDGLNEDEERILLGDENFLRCPVSKEVFEFIWDDEESQIYYRNAVKVLVTAVADPDIYTKCFPTLRAEVRYCIVHTKLVLDEWLSCGKAATLRNAMLRYQAISKNEVVTNLLAAVGLSVPFNEENDDLDNIFVLLEL